MAKFRLQAVLDARERAEKLMQKEFAEQLQVVQQTEAEIAAMQSSLSECVEELNQSKSIGITAAQLQFHEKYRYKLKHDLNLLHQRLNEQTQELGLRHQAMVKAAQKRRVLEVLRDKDFAKAEKEAFRKERIEADEIAQMHSLRKR